MRGPWFTSAKFGINIGISSQWSCSIPVAEIEVENFGIRVYFWGHGICGLENSKFEKILCQNDWWGLPDECERKIKKIGPLEREISGNELKELAANAGNFFLTFRIERLWNACRYPCCILLRKEHSTIKRIEVVLKIITFCAWKGWHRIENR